MFVLTIYCISLYPKQTLKVLKLTIKNSTMSRSNPNNVPVNPAKRYFEWDSNAKQFKYYDKELPHPTDKDKKGANVLVKLPFTFLVLDQLTTIKGYNKKENGIWSNEVRDLKKEPLSIRVKSGLVATGLYSDELLAKMQGAKYSKSVYIAFYEPEKDANGNILKTPEGKVIQKLAIGNIQLYGASLGPWIDLCKQYKKLEEESIAISAYTFKEDKTGNVDFSMPVFKVVPVTDKTNQEAVELDKVLQAYFKDYFQYKPSQEEVVSETAQTNTTSAPVSALMPETSFVSKGAVDNTELANAIDNFPTGDSADDSDLPF